MAREFDANEVSNWAKNRAPAKKGAGSVGGEAAVGDDAAAAGDGGGAKPETLGECLRALEEAATAHLEVLSEIKLPAADAKAFRKRLDALNEDMKTFLEDVTELADDYDEEHADDEGSGEDDEAAEGEDD